MCKDHLWFLPSWMYSLFQKCDIEFPLEILFLYHMLAWQESVKFSPILAWKDPLWSCPPGMWTLTQANLRWVLHSSQKKGPAMISDTSILIFKCSLILWAFPQTVLYRNHIERRSKIKWRWDADSKGMGWFQGSTFLGQQLQEFLGQWSENTLKNITVNCQWILCLNEKEVISVLYH